MKLILLTFLILASGSLLAVDDSFDFMPESKDERLKIDLTIENETKEVVTGLKVRARWFEGQELLQVIYRNKQIFVFQKSESGGIYVESFPGNELFCSYTKHGNSDFYYLTVTKHLSEPDSFQIYIVKTGVNTYRISSELNDLLKEIHLNQTGDDNSE
ncbi:MAG: hypothetical protein ACSHX8_16070 [Opitutaceae bacterium]